jgi:hypothetical protein
MKTKFDIVRELREENKSAKEIAEITGFNINVIYNYITIINERNKAKKIKAEPGHNKDRSLCKTCIYRSREEQVKNCDYIIIIGHSRECDVEDCDKYVKGKRIDGHFRSSFK